MIKQTDKSKILVIGIISIGIIVSVLVNQYLVGASATQADLKKIDCYTLFPTVCEIQQQKINISQEQTCDILNRVANLQSLDIPYKSDANDPWHYFGRIRISPKNSVWFIIFMAKKSNNYKPIFSLHRRRGSGWGIVGQFDANEVLKIIGINDKINLQKLEGESSLIPTDYSTPF